MECCATLRCVVMALCIKRKLLDPYLTFAHTTGAIALIVWLKSTFSVVGNATKKRVSPSEKFGTLFSHSFCNRFAHCFLIIGRFRAILTFLMIQCEEAHKDEKLKFCHPHQRIWSSTKSLTNHLAEQTLSLLADRHRWETRKSLNCHAAFFSFLVRSMLQVEITHG